MKCLEIDTICQRYNKTPSDYINNSDYIDLGFDLMVAETALKEEYKNAKRHSSELKRKGR